MAVKLVLFHDVQNAAAVKELLIKSKIDAAIVDARLIVDPFQVVVAANIAYEKFTSETLKCRNVNTQFVSCISPHISISKALTNFGISEDTTYMLAVVMDPTPEKIANLRQVVVGTELQGVENELKSRYEADLVRQKYDISQRENATSELLDSIVSRIACREIH